MHSEKILILTDIFLKAIVIQGKRKCRQAEIASQGFLLNRF